MNAAIETFRDFATTAQKLGATGLRAVATSAVRDADNGSDFCKRVLDDVGFRLETIDGAEEARLVQIAVASRIDISQGTWLLADLGGGSVEATILIDGDKHWSKSFNVGAVRLLDDGDYKSAATLVEAFQVLENRVDSEVNLPAEAISTSVQYAATGGNIESLAKLCGEGRKDGPVAKIAVEEMATLVKRLAELPVGERSEQFKLKPDRSDVIVPAGLIYLRLATLVNAAEIQAPFVGLREGLLLDLARTAFG